MMFGKACDVEADVFGDAGNLDDLVEHPLPVFRFVTDRTLPQPLLHGGGKRGQKT